MTQVTDARPTCVPKYRRSLKLRPPAAADAGAGDRGAGGVVVAVLVSCRLLDERE